MKRHKLGNSKRWVIKIGSSLLTAEGRGLGSLAAGAGAVAEVVANA